MGGIRQPALDFETETLDGGRFSRVIQAVWPGELTEAHIEERVTVLLQP